MKKVVATKPGFYNSLRNPGDKFEVTDETPTGTWMKRTDGVPDEDVDILAKTPSREYRDPTPVDDPFVGNNDEVVDVHEVKKGAKTGKK